LRVVEPVPDDPIAALQRDVAELKARDQVTRHLTFAQAAELSGLPVRELKAAAESGLLGVMSLGGKQYLTAELLNEFCERMTRLPNSGHSLL
jgi:hypothetical protein